MKNNFLTHFAVTFLQNLKNIEEILQPNSDEATLHPSGQGDRYNCRIWGINNLHAVIEGSHGASPHFTILCAVSRDKSSGLSVFPNALSLV